MIRYNEHYKRKKKVKKLMKYTSVIQERKENISLPNLKTSKNITDVTLILFSMKHR